MEPIKPQVPSGPAFEQASVHQDSQVIKRSVVHNPSCIIGEDSTSPGAVRERPGKRKLNDDMTVSFSLDYLLKHNVGMQNYNKINSAESCAGAEIETLEPGNKKRRLNDGSPLIVSFKRQSFQASAAGNMELHNQINPAVRNAETEIEQFDELGNSAPLLEVEANVLEPGNNKITLSGIKSLLPCQLLTLFQQHGIAVSGDSEAAPTIYSEKGNVINLSEQAVEDLKFAHVKLHWRMNPRPFSPDETALLKTALGYDQLAKIADREWKEILDKRDIGGECIFSPDEQKTLNELRGKARRLINSRNFTWKQKVIKTLSEAENQSDDGKLGSWTCSPKKRKLNGGSSSPLPSSWSLSSGTGDAIRGYNQAMPVVRGVEQSNEVTSSVTVSGENALEPDNKKITLSAINTLIAADLLELFQQHGVAETGGDGAVPVIYDKEDNVIELSFQEKEDLFSAHQTLHKEIKSKLTENEQSVLEKADVSYHALAKSTQEEWGAIKAKAEKTFLCTEMKILMQLHRRGQSSLWEKKITGNKQ